MPDDRNRLGGRNVVARLPVEVVKISIELFRKDFLAPGKPIATAHKTSILILRTLVTVEWSPLSKPIAPPSR